jgi:PAS domain S-box-containing protein
MGQSFPSASICPASCFEGAVYGPGNVAPSNVGTMRLSVTRLTRPAAHRGKTDLDQARTMPRHRASTARTRVDHDRRSPEPVGSADPLTAEVVAADSDARFRSFLSDIDVGALMLDAAGCVLFINDHLLALLGRSRAEMVGQDWIDVAVPLLERDARRETLLRGIAEGSLASQRESSMVTASGEVRRLSWTSVMQRDPQGDVVGVASLGHDVTEAYRVEADRSLLAAAVKQTADAVIVTDAAGDILFVNPAFERISGYARDDVIGTNPRFLQAAHQEPDAFTEVWATLSAGKDWRGEMANRRKDGSEFTGAMTITPIFDVNGVLTAFISVQRDISRIREVEADLILEAAVRTLLGEAIQAAAISSGLEEAAQAVCDGLASLPGIGVVHLVAFLGDDDALVVASGQPEGSPLTPEMTTITAARGAQLRAWAAMGPWGEGSRSSAEAAQMDEAMHAAGMLGLAFGPIRHGDHVEGVLMVGTRERRFAATVAEKMPPLVGFGASANTLLVERLHERSREFDLRRVFDTVLATGAFRPVFQPIVDLATGETVGYEALTRFDSGERPDTCFADAWSVSMGVELELATLESAIMGARDLPAGRWLDLNVSPRLFDAADRLAALVGSADRPVVVEITEHELIHDYAAVRGAAAALGSGVRLAVDDAGVGVANFGHIIELRPDFVKLDMSLVRRVNVDLGRQALVVAMRHFARTAGCRLIAEGIETDEEARALRQLGVEFGQGYWYGRPQPVEHWAAGSLEMEIHQPGD